MEKNSVVLDSYGAESETDECQKISLQVCAAYLDGGVAYDEEFTLYVPPIVAGPFM